MESVAFAMVVVRLIVLAQIAYCGKVCLILWVANMSCCVQNVMELVPVQNFGRILVGLSGVRSAMAMPGDFVRHVEVRTKYHVRNAISASKCRKEG